MKKLFLKMIPAVLLSSGLSFFASAENYSKEFSGISETFSEITFNFDKIDTKTVEVGGQLFTRIVFDSGVTTVRKGYAELPVLSASVQVSDLYDVVISSVEGEYEEIELEHPLLPSRGTIFRNQDPASVPYITDPESLTDSMYPLSSAEITEPFIFRDTRGVSVYAYPVRYNAAKRIVRIYKSLSVKLDQDIFSSTNPLNRRSEKIDPTMNDIYSSLYINYSEPKFTHQLSEFGDILVISTSRDTEVIKPYIDWKRQKGFDVKSITVDTGTNVKAVILQEYQLNPDILYVQLVGDWAEIKSDLGPDSSPTDPMLGCVLGTDIYPELIIGRFSAGTTTDVTTQVNKTISYEMSPDMTGTWYKSGLGIGSPEGDGIGDDGEIDYAHIDVIKENKLLPFTYNSVNEAYGNPTAATVANYINSGLSIINYCGHGSNTSWGTSGYSNTNVNSSTNGSMLPVIFSVACVNGAFHSGTCFAEAWLRKSGGGAAATLMSTINQPWVPPMRGQDYMNDILIGGYDYSANPGNGTTTRSADHRTTFGSVSMNGCVLMLAESADSETQNTIKTWTVFGDASLQIRTDTPRLIENTNQFVFPELYSTRIVSSGDPVEGAVVSLFQGEISFSGITDANGEVTVDHPFVDGEVIITVSGFNLETLQSAVSVQAPEGPWLKIEDYSFSTNYSGEISNASLLIRNIGLQSSENVILKISTESPYINMINDEYAPDAVVIESGGSVSTDIIAFTISPMTPDQERILLYADITDSYTKRTYRSNIYLTVGSPELEITHLFSTPTALQGITRTVTFIIENTGHAPITDLTADLVQTTLFDVGLTGSVHIDIIEAGSGAEAVFYCSYGETIPNSSYVMYDLSVNSSSGYSFLYDYDEVVGLTDGFETGDFSSNGWVHSGDINWVIDTTEFYEGLFSANSGSVGHSQKSIMTVSFDFVVDGKISFFRKVSSESGYDKLNFYVDGVFKKNWSGISDWLKFEYEVTAGLHEFKWEFIRDASIDNGSNCAWVDNILATGISTGIEEEAGILPSEPKLHQNFPNPFNPVTKIRFAMAKDAEVKLNVYNISGQKVAELVNGSRQAGVHAVDFDGSRFNSGVYYYSLETSGTSLTRKMLLIK
ncbi:MAG: C25 family cysteine peptidase [Candidatus Delongbacteria bacterium]|jgi:gingipain R|nr:C25 family cysteine peptidase [Candidatus Delongbacteria bacterium]